MPVHLENMQIFNLLNLSFRNHRMAITFWLLLICFPTNTIETAIKPVSLQIVDNGRFHLRKKDRPRRNFIIYFKNLWRWIVHFTEMTQFFPHFHWRHSELKLVSIEFHYSCDKESAQQWYTIFSIQFFSTWNPRNHWMITGEKKLGAVIALSLF